MTRQPKEDSAITLEEQRSEVFLGRASHKQLLTMSLNSTFSP